MHANPRVCGNRVRRCEIKGKPFDSIKEGFAELKQLRKGVSYWMLYRALRSGKNTIGDISIKLIDEPQGWRHG